MTQRIFIAALAGAIVLGGFAATTSSAWSDNPVTISTHSVRINLGHFSKAQEHVFLALNVPADYKPTNWGWARGGFGIIGDLQGPPQNGKPDSPSGMKWRVETFYPVTSAKERAQKLLSCCDDWEVRFSQQLSLPHTINGNQVGTITAWAAEHQQDRALGPAHSGADATAVLDFFLPGTGNNTVYEVTYDASEPFYTGLVVIGPAVFVKGIAAEPWNAAAALNGVKGIEIQGNLPPANVTAAVQPETVSGRVSDAYGGPLVGVGVQLLRGAHVVTTSRTTAHGTYSLSLRNTRPGRYTVVTKLNGITVVHTVQVH